MSDADSKNTTASEQAANVSEGQHSETMSREFILQTFGQYMARTSRFLYKSLDATIEEQTKKQKALRLMKAYGSNEQFWNRWTKLKTEDEPEIGSSYNTVLGQIRMFDTKTWKTVTTYGPADSPAVTVLNKEAAKGLKLLGEPMKAQTKQFPAIIQNMKELTDILKLEYSEATAKLAEWAASRPLEDTAPPETSSPPNTDHSGTQDHGSKGTIPKLHVTVYGPSVDPELLPADAEQSVTSLLSQRHRGKGRGRKLTRTSDDENEQERLTPSRGSGRKRSKSESSDPSSGGTSESEGSIGSWSAASS